MTWESCVGRIAVDEVFAAAFAAGRKAHVAMKEGKEMSFMQQSFVTHEQLQVCCERTCLFVPESEGPRVFGAELKNLPVKLTQVKIETGEVVSGIVIADPRDGAVRRLHLRVLSGTCLEGQILDPHKQIRPGQGDDIQNWYNADFIKMRAALLAPTLPSQEDVCKLAKEHQSKLAETQAVAASAALGEAEAVQKEALDIEGKAGDNGGAEDVTSSESEAPVLLPSQAHDGGKARGRGKGSGKAKAKEKAKKKRNLSAAPKAAAATAASAKRRWLPTAGTGAVSSNMPPPSCKSSAYAQSERSRSRSPTVVSRDSGETMESTTSPNTSSKLDRHLSAIDLGKIVLGKKLGNEYNNGKRSVATFMEENPAAAVQLEAHLKLAQVAMEATIAKLPKLSPSVRGEKLKSLYSHMTHVPDAWKIAIFGSYKRESELSLDSECH